MIKIEANNTCRDATTTYKLTQHRTVSAIEQLLTRLRKKILKYANDIIKKMLLYWVDLVHCCFVVRINYSDR